MIKFIKRFCYRFSKRLIRLFIFFTVLVCFFSFSFSSFASYGRFDEFVNFDAFVGDGQITTYSGVDYALTEREVFSSSTTNLNSAFLITAPESGVDYMDSCAVKISGDTNFNYSFNAGDYLYLRNTVNLFIYTSDTRIYYGYENADLDDIRVRIDTSQGYVVLSGDDVIQSIALDSGSFSCNINFEIKYQFNTAAELKSITFFFYHALDDYGIGVWFQGRGADLTGNQTPNRKIYFYLGSESTLNDALDTNYLSGISNATSEIGAILKDNFTDNYPEFVSPENDELVELEDEVIDKFDYSGQFNYFFNGNNGWYGFFERSEIVQCFLVLDDMFDYITTFLPMRFLMYLSISLGLLSMTLNFTAVLVSNMSQDKRGDFNRHGSVGRGHGGGR